MTFPNSVGAIIAVVVLILTVIFGVLGRLDILVASLLAALAVARLL